MAFASVGSLGSTQSKTANQSTLVITTSATLEAGHLGVLLIGVDNNSSGDGDEGAVSGVVDSAGNIWTKAIEFRNGEAGAGEGAVCSMWYKIVSSQLPSGGTITATFTNTSSRDASAGTAWEYTVGTGSSVSIEAFNTLATDGANDPGSLNATTSSVECLRIRGWAREDSSLAFTPTASWTGITSNGTTGGVGATNMWVGGEFIISTGTGNASNPDEDGADGSADMASVYIAFKEVSGTQALTPNLFTDTDTFHVEIVSATYSLLPNLFTDTDTFYAAQVALANSQFLFPSLFTDSDTFYAPTVLSVYRLTPSLFSDSDTFYAGAVTTTYSILPGLFTDGDTFYAAVVARQASNLLPTLFSDEDIFFVPVLTRGRSNYSFKNTFKVKTKYRPWKPTRFN